MTTSVRLRVSSECFRFVRAFVELAFLFLPVLTFSSMWSSSFSLHIDCKDILGKFVLVGDRIVEENHEFCSVEREHILDEVEGELSELVIIGNHNFRDHSATCPFQ